MIRFRIGHSWKREPDAAPVDSFGLDLDGVDLLAGASEEPLTRVVPDLLEAVFALTKGGKRCAQVSLAEAGLELALYRHGLEVELLVASLGRPARRVRPPVRVELPELCEAAVRCGHTLVRDLAEAAPAWLKETRHRRMLERLSALEGSAIRDLPSPAAGATHHHPAGPPPAFGFELEDRFDRLLQFDSRSPCALASLLCEGKVYLEVREAEPAWELKGLPFLTVLELSRQGAEVVRALEAGDEAVDFHPAGSPTRARLYPKQNRLELGAASFEVEPQALARALFEVGLAFCLWASARHKPQAKNPYLLELAGRCKEGLAQLRAAIAPTGAPARPARVPRQKKGAAAKPLRTSGKLRRLRFEKLWEKSNLGGDTPGQLVFSRRGPVFASNQMACAFTVRGELLYRHVASHGVAAGPDGLVLTASATRVLCFRGAEHSARWLRTHDGIPLGPLLHRKDGLLIAPSGGHAVACFAELSGRELWRFDPPRTQRSHLSIQGHRALLATDAGFLYGLDLEDGQLRFRMQAALPFACATVPFGKKLLALLNRGERTALFAADAHSGQVGFTQEISLSAPTPPLPIGSRILLAGRRDGHPWLVCLSGQGKVLWERKLPLGNGPLAITAAGRDVVAADTSGAVTLVGGEGQVEWRLGACGAELPFAIAPRLSRRVLMVAGEAVRAIDPRGGTVLAEVRAGLGLCDLAVDSKLNLFLLDEEGTLEAYHLASHFALV